MRMRTQILLVLILPALSPLLFILVRPEPPSPEDPSPSLIESIEKAIPPSGARLEPPRILVVGADRYVVFRVRPGHETPSIWAPFTITILFYILLVFLVVLFFHRFNKSIVSLANATKIIAQGSLDTPTKIHGSQEIRVLAEALEQMRIQLKDARERKSFLLMGLSHDFRTPITSIKGYAEALQDRMGSTPEEESEFLSIIHEKAVQLEDMVSRWLELVRLETEDRYAVFKSVNLFEYFQRLGRRFSLDAKISNHRFEWSVEIPKHWECALDQGLIDRCLDNLFYNATKATPPKGILGLKVYSGALGLVVDFWDNGSGVGTNEKLIIWEPFYRGRESSGLGLGLAVVKSILTSHRWTISLVDTPVGAHFRILIPQSVVSGFRDGKIGSPD